MRRGEGLIDITMSRDMISSEALGCTWEGGDEERRGID